MDVGFGGLVQRPSAVQSTITGFDAVLKQGLQL